MTDFLDFQVVGTFKEPQSSSVQQQRTEEWLESRKGRYTGSNFKLLMGCGRSTSKMGWDRIEKIVDFGATAEKYIYKVGNERLTGLRDMDIYAKSMEHGKENEPKLIEQLIKDGVITDFEEVPFVEFKRYSNAGSSPDGIAKFKGKLVAIETKCTTSWDGHFARMYEPVHEKHNDFWQVQAEAESLGVDSTLYVTAKPGVFDQYDYQLVDKSETHIKALIARCRIADLAISLWPEHGYKESLIIACARYQDKFS